MKLFLNSASVILCCRLPGCVLQDFSPWAKHHFHILYHQIRQDFRVSISFVVVYPLGDQLPSSIGCGYSASLKPRSVRLEGRLLSSLHSLCRLFLSWVHISPCSACLVCCSLTRFWSISCQYYDTMSRESWATGQLLDPHQRRSASASLSANYVIIIPLWSLQSSCLHSFITLPLADNCQCC